MTRDRKVVDSNPGIVYWMESKFCTLICCKKLIEVCLKRPKINEKEAGVCPLFEDFVGKQSFIEPFMMLIEIVRNIIQSLKSRHKTCLPELFISY